MNKDPDNKDIFSYLKEYFCPDEFDTDTYCQYLEQILENAHDGIYINDGEANALFINTAFERISGLDREMLLGVNHRKLVEDGIIVRSGCLEVMEKRREVTLVLEYLTTKRQALVTCTPIFDKNGQIIMIISSVRDLDELNNLNTRFIEEVGLRQKYEKELELIKEKESNSDYLIAKDEKMANILILANRMSKVDSTVLITGESGVGKDVVARYIHSNGSRKKGPFVAINCGALPEHLIESELFGYENGAFTGAKKTGKAGLIEVAEGGTLFLDEVGDLPLNVQVRLLRCIQNKTITRLGGTREISVNVRLISATNKDLKKLVEDNMFREDLYYRLCVVPIHIPPLRERLGDIQPLADYYIDYYNKQYGYHKKLSESAYRTMYAYNWPGNIRELKNLIERVVVTTETDLIMADNLPIFNETLITSNIDKPVRSLKEQVERFEYDQILLAYEKFKNVRVAASYLGMSEPTYVRKRKDYNKKYGF